MPSAQASTTTVVNGNYLPVVHAEQMGTSTANISWAWDNTTVTTTTNSSNGSTTNTEVTSSYYNGTLVGMNVTLYHSALDPEGGMMYMGWDMDLDGAVDIPVNGNSGFTTIYIPLSDWHSIPSTEMKLISAAFIAADPLGGLGVVVIDIYSVTPEGPWSQYYWTGLYAFSGKDAQNSPTSGTDDNLIMLTMDQGSDINWASVSVKLAIDGAAPVTCDNPGVGGTAVCALVEFGNTEDQFWSVGDGVTVVENGADLCDSACSIDVTITDTREGKTIDTTNGVPAE